MGRRGFSEIFDLIHTELSRSSLALKILWVRILILVVSRIPEFWNRIEKWSKDVEEYQLIPF